MQGGIIIIIVFPQSPFCRYAGIPFETTILFLDVIMNITVLQVILVQFGDVVFSCVALSIEQWGWCLFFGFGTLLWSQVNISELTKLFRALQANDVTDILKFGTAKKRQKGNIIGGSSNM